jgi:hypothetical protein
MQEHAEEAVKAHMKICKKNFFDQRKIKCTFVNDDTEAETQRL